MPREASTNPSYVFGLEDSLASKRALVPLLLPTW